MNYEMIMDRITKCNMEISELEWEANEAYLVDDLDEVMKITRKLDKLAYHKSHLLKLYDEILDECV